MNKLLTRKKHSKIIAKLLLKKENIDKKFYDNLYIEYYRIFKRPKRKNKYGHRFTRYYPELYFFKVDYYGEADEISVIYMIEEEIYWNTCIFNENGETIKHGLHFNKTKDLIKYIRVKNLKWEQY